MSDSDRQHDNTLNVFEGVLHSRLFLTVTAIMVGGQLIIVFVSGTVFSVVPLTGWQWAVCIVLGALSLLVGLLIRLLPDEPFARAAKLVAGRLRKAKVLLWPCGRRKRRGHEGGDEQEAASPAEAGS